MEFPYGTIAPAPQGFAPPEAWPEYGHAADLAPIVTYEHAGEVPGALRWALWPLCFEEHIGDSEPDIARASAGELAYNRFVMWRRIARTDVPKGWIAPSSKPPEVDGVRVLDGDICAGWNKNARRDLRAWLARRGTTHSIEPVSLREYAAAYEQSLTARRLNTNRLRDLKRKLALSRTAAHTQLWGVRDLATGRLVAGTAVIHSPTYKSSAHFAPFMCEEARAVYAATGLMHHWFATAQRRGDRFAVSTNFWFPGKPKSWRGFSEFKSHFGFSYVAYPPVVWRFVRGKLI